ncbi:MAG: helix-turn-helix domain-containing protein [Nocardioidaceae bacterium]|nr:helix-turn-helix domain-containing protein [Nocardioidaceae bacterium]
MGRTRTFQESEAVDAAAEVFRQRGYAATSVDNLVEATGVHRGSLYGAFGSKHGLFMRALDAVDTTRDPASRLDLALIGLLELAPGDPHVRERIAGVLEAHDITEEQLGRRLLTRAGLPRSGGPT